MTGHVINDDSLVAGFAVKALQQLAAGGVEQDPVEWARFQLNAMAELGYIEEAK